MIDANSVFEPLAIGATLIADKFIMVDDYNSSNFPSSKSNEAGENGLNKSMF
jgi:hypothetical protein